MILNLPPFGPAKNRAGFFGVYFCLFPQALGDCFLNGANQD